MKWTLGKMITGKYNPNDEHRGGKREGAGRKPSGKKKRNYYVTEEEHEAIKKLIEQMRQS